MKGIIKNFPNRSDIYADINEHLVLEYYSR